MAALAYFSVFIILIYMSFLLLSAKNLSELKKYFLFSSLILFVIGVIGHINEKTSLEGSFILGIFILMLLIISITSVIKVLTLKEPDYPILIIAYCFFVYASASVFVSFLSWAGVFVEVQKNTGG